MLTALSAAHVLTPAGGLRDTVVLVGNGKIVALGPAQQHRARAKHVQDFGKAMLAPAFLDIHIHGAAGYDVMDASPSGQQRMQQFLAKHGTARFLPTTLTAPVDVTLHSLEILAGWIESAAKNDLPTAKPIGIHLEGPFISPQKCGVQPVEHMQPPNIELFDRFFDAAQGHIRLMTVAAELPGAPELIGHAKKRGVRVSLGHSDASADQARAGILAGASSATHTFNAMRGFDHREPGLLGAVLDSRDLYAELICDGHHIAPEAVRLFAAAKPRERRILITDAISATGEGEGRFPLGKLKVSVSGDRATFHGKLAGSVLTLDHAVQRFAAEAGVAIAEAALAASANPARMLGLPEAMKVGASADFVVLDENGALLATIFGGERCG